MEGQQHQMVRIEADIQPPKQQVQSPPPSASSSPSHEFSFTISLHPSAAAAKLPDKASPPPFAAIDLSPADEIFFHGHLLPLHLLSHLPVSPRSSTNSLDSFTLPIKDLLPDNPAADNNNNNNLNNNKTSSTTSSEEYSANIDDDDDHDHRRRRRHRHHQESRHVLEGKGRGKSKSFSLFGIPKWRKHDDHHQEKERNYDHQQKRSSKFEILIKRYMRFIKPFLSLRNKSGSSDEFLRQQPYSYSGNLRFKSNKKEVRGRRGEFSAPASMITSPTNSGLLVASGTVTPTKNDSTMEELQAAIQAAIAHCKNSIAEDKSKIKLP